MTIGTVKPIGWTCIIFFGLCALFAWRAGQSGAAAGFMPFILLGAYSVYGGYSRYAIESDQLKSASPSGRRYQLDWSEVKWVEVGTSGTLVFHGEDKRFVIPPPSLWRGCEKPQMYATLVNQLDVRKLVPVPSNTADYKINKNVRIYDAA